MAGTRRKRGERLLEETEEETGISNPTLEEEDEVVPLASGGESGGETLDETQEADALVTTLKKTRKKIRKKLAADLISPKDDLSRELKDAKKRSKQKVDESVRAEMEESRVTEVADDGTLPMPEGEEEEGVVPLGEEAPGSPKEGEEAEESEVKRLRKKKEKVEETPIEPTEEEKEEPPPRPPSPVIAEPEPEGKTPRMMSLRMKMRDRLQKAKEEAMSEVRAEAKESRRERRMERDKIATTRFDEGVDAEALERMTEERRKARDERKKKMAEGALKGVYMPTMEEAFDFFTRNWEPEPEEEKEKAVEKQEKEKKEKKEGEEAKEGEEEPGPSEPKEGEEEGEGEPKEPKPGKAEDEQPLLPEEEEDLGYGLTVVRPAYLPDPAEQEQKEAKILFYPSGSSIPATEKVEKESQPRFLEDEGFYVGTRPETSGWNQNRMEHRLLKEAESGRLSSKKWFGEDGRLLALPDPLRANPSRPPVTEEVEPYLQTVYRKAVMSEFDNRYIDGSNAEGGGHYQLDVDINQIAFSHHHLYSREHVLAQRLTQLFEQYVVRQKKNMTEYLGEKLKALKNSAFHLQDHIRTHTAEHSLTDRANYDRRLQDYKAEIRQTRSLRNREEQADRTLLKNIIHTWKEIKQLRDFQKFNNTSVKLQVKKEEVDKEQDRLLWQQEIEEEVEETKEEHEREFRRKMLTYEEEMAKYQKQQQAKKEAAKRRRKKGRRGSRQSAASGSAAEDISDSQLLKDQEILDEPDLPEPDKPEPFEEGSIRDTVKAKAMEIRRRPGEPKLHLELSNTASITPNTTCPRGEQQRRDEVSKCKVFVKILFNNKEVSRTPAKPLSQDFKVSFGQIYNLKIVQWPESITFQVYESYGLGNHLMAELCAPIPDVSVTSKSVQIEDLEFSSDHRISHSHEGVGSGLPFTFGAKGEDVLTLMTTGIQSFSVAWAVDEQGSALVPPMSTTNINNLFNAMKKMDPVAAIGATGVMDLQKLAKWFADSRLDPNDPSNADIVYMLRGRSGETSQLVPAEYFRLEQLMEEFDFIEEMELRANRRFQLLELRDGEVQEFRNYKMVPINEKEIPRDTFTEYEKKKAEEQKLKQMEDIESHRAAVARFMQRIREQVMRRFRILAHQKRHDDVVYEEAVPNIALLGTSLLKLTERRRPLRPERKERKKVIPQNIKPDDVKILVNVARASNVPVRLQQVGGEAVLSEYIPTPRSPIYDGEYIYGYPQLVGPYGSTTAMLPQTAEIPGMGATMAGGTMTARGGETMAQTRLRGEEVVFDATMVRPFVEVMFQHNSVRTSVGDGPNPSFNEELELPFKAPNDDFSTSNLQTVNDNIYLNLFDEVVVDIQQDDRERGTQLHQRIEKKWLGSLKIPFSTLYFNGKIDGTFRVDAPPVLLGYTQQKTMEGEMDLGVQRDNRTLLGMFITIEPPLTQAEPMKEKFHRISREFFATFSTTEDTNLMKHADEWKENVTSRFTEKREVKTTVIDVNGKAVFATRYFKALKPPDDLTNKGLSAEATADLVARYVSLIPFVSDSVVFPGLCDIWSTCDQFLQMLAGDEEEHAVLLVNYFLSLGKKAWLVCGTAIPEGPTAYVMTQETSGEYWIWNAGTGEHFQTRDNNCPLQTIGCVINNENVWANIQQYEKPSQLVFNLADTSCWDPVFNGAFRSPGLGSIQPESLYYFPTEKEYVSELQEKIQTLLKNKIMDWRSRYITRWNRHCTQIMRKLLPILEENCGRSVGEQHIHELEQSFSTYKVSGFPINMPFTEMGPIVETVYATGVHAQESSDVEFALAVYVHPYPNSVLSVWVYVASLLRMR